MDGYYIIVTDNKSIVLFIYNVEMETIKIKVRNIYNRWLWLKYCKEFGKNEYAINEWLIDMEDEIEVNADFIKNNL